MSRTAAASVFFATMLVGSLPTLGKAPKERTFNHWEDNKSLTYRVSVEPDEYFVITVEDTCPEMFTFEGVGVESKDSEIDWDLAQASLNAAREKNPKDEKTLAEYLKERGVCLIKKGASRQEESIPHRAAFGGYQFGIKKKAVPSEAGSSVSAFFKETWAVRVPSDHELLKEKKTREEWDELYDKEPLEPRELNEVTLFIVIEKPGWDFDVSGGFTTSWLTDPQFAVVTRDVDTDGDSNTPDESLQLVVREPGREDGYRPGLAAFVHLDHARFKHWAPLAFGLGIDTGNNSELNYFLGTGLRFSKRGSLLGGVNVGPVSTLPPGVQVSPDPAGGGFDPMTDLGRLRPVTDANVLNNLNTRTDAKFFVGISFSFLKPVDDRFRGRFATSEDTTEDGDNGESGEGTE